MAHELRCITGHIRANRGHYYIEPVKDHEPEEDGQQLHVIYKSSIVARINDHAGRVIWKHA
jgi:hypothetical protein